MGTSWFFSVIFIFSFLTMGCASFVEGRREYVEVVSTPPGAPVRYQGRVVGSTPVYVPIENSHQESLEVGDQPQVLKGRYRWGWSFAGNLAFLTLAPVGWLWDFATGKAYQMPERVHVEIPPSERDFLYQASELSRKPRVLVAPPRSNHPDVTDEVGEALSALLRERLKAQYEVIEGPAVRELFEERGAKFDRDLSPEERKLVLNIQNADFIYESDVVVRGSTVEAAGNLVSAKGKVQKSLESFVWPRSQFETTGEKGFYSSSKIFYFLPNSLGLDLTSSNSTLDIDGREVNGESESAGGALGSVFKVLSAVGVRRVFAPTKRDEWRWRFSFLPAAGFAYSRESFPDSTVEPEREYTRSHVSVGYGPSIMYYRNKWSVFVTYTPMLAYDRIESGPGIEADDTHLTFAFETGVRRFFGQNWYWQLFAKTVDVPEEIWEEVVRESSGQTGLGVKTSSLSTTSFSIGYLFPNKTFRRWNEH